MNKYTELINKRSREEWISLMYNWVHNKRDREMLALRMLDGEDYADIGDKYYISSEYCRQRVGVAKKQLFSHIEISK
jgi:hypothetical protein